MNKLYSTHKRKAGFTLIELIIVIAILAILAAILVPLMVSYLKEARQAVANANVRTLYSAATSGAAMLLARTPAETPTDITNTSTDNYATVVKNLLGTGFEEDGATWSVKYSEDGITTTWTAGDNTVGNYPAQTQLGNSTGATDSN